MPTFTLPFLAMALMPGFMAYLRAFLVVTFVECTEVPLRVQGSVMREVTHVQAAASFPPCPAEGAPKAFAWCARSS